MTRAMLAALALAGCVTAPLPPAEPVDRAQQAFDRVRPIAVSLIARLSPTRAIGAGLILMAIEEALRAAHTAPSPKEEAAQLRRAATAMAALADEVR